MLRIDAAGYQAEIVNHCRASDIRFAIRAKMDSAVRESMSAIKSSDWQPLILADGSVSDQEEVARTLHVMHETPEAFALVVQRRLINEAERDPQQELFREWLGEVDDESATCGIYIYRAIATDLDLDSCDDHQIVRFYNQRANTSDYVA